MSERRADSNPRIVVVGASAGGVAALRELVAGLNADLYACVFVVIHLPATARSMLAEILARAGPLPAATPRDRETLVSGRIYVARPDHHLLVDGPAVRVVRGPWENGFRPSIDALFRSAAYWYGPRVVAVILSGSLDDGSAGLAAVVEGGGVALVQDPSEAGVMDMPANALATVPNAVVADVDAIAARINEIAGVGKATEPTPFRDSLDDGLLATELAVLQGAPVAPDELGAAAAGLSCPDCEGSLFLVDDRSMPRFRCRVGHGWTSDALLAANERSLEETLLAAIRMVEDSQAVDDRVNSRLRRKPGSFGHREALRRAEERVRLIAALRAALEHLGATPTDTAATELAEHEHRQSADAEPS